MFSNFNSDNNYNEGYNNLNMSLDIDRRLKKSPDTSRPSREELISLNLKLKFHYPDDVSEESDSFMSALENLPCSQFRHICETGKLVIFHLDDVMLFQYLSPDDVQGNTFFIGFTDYPRVYDHYPSYQQLRNRNALHVVTREYNSRQSTKVLFKEAFQKFDRQLKISIEITVITPDYGWFPDDYVTTSRGRKVKFITPNTIKGNSRGVNITADDLSDITS